MAFLKAMGAFFGTIFLTVYAAAPIPLALYWWFSADYIDLLERVQRYDHQQAEYWFTGANHRDLVDICKGADGEVKVLWKEDCE